ncbi:hypothetical protein OPQ81_005527 [Rhizoctonia solani]|nr:hypothetical protein OPQ81_005527 [Rhizoctonia solani]
MAKYENQPGDPILNSRPTLARLELAACWGSLGGMAPVVPCDRDAASQLPKLQLYLLLIELPFALAYLRLPLIPADSYLRIMQPLVEPDDPNLHDDDDEAGKALTALAPIEETSPLGYNVNFMNALLVNTSAMIGVGILSTPSFVLRSVGSVGMLIALYLFVPLITLAGLVVYIEMTSMCGHKRSGAEVVYLEEAYPKPRFLLPTTFALITALLSHSAVNATVFSKYVLDGYGIEVTPFRQRFIAIFMATIAIWVCLFPNKWALRVNGVAAFFKILCLVLISTTGLGCLLGWTPTPNTGNLTYPFEGSLYEPGPLATSAVQISYSFVGWNSILGLMAEVKGRHPVRTIRRASIASIIITATLFITTLLSFSIVLTKEDHQVISYLHWYYYIWGNSITEFILWKDATRSWEARDTTIRHFLESSGAIQNALWASTLEMGLDCFIDNCHTCSGYCGIIDEPCILCGSGIFPIDRVRYLGIEASEETAWSLALLIMPWIPPEGSSKGGNVGPFYASYCIIAFILFLLCGFYYWVRFCALPQWLGYKFIEETVSLPGGVKVMALKKVYMEQFGNEQESLLQRER